MEERRRFNRCNLEQRVRLSQAQQRVKDAILLDVGMGGMRIILDQKAELGAELFGQFKILPSMGSFHIQGVVVWVKLIRRRAQEKWEAGVKFSKVATTNDRDLNRENNECNS